MEGGRPSKESSSAPNWSSGPDITAGRDAAACEGGSSDVGVCNCGGETLVSRAARSAGGRDDGCTGGGCDTKKEGRTEAGAEKGVKAEQPDPKEMGRGCASTSGRTADRGGGGTLAEETLDGIASGWKVSGLPKPGIGFAGGGMGERAGGEDDAMTDVDAMTSAEGPSDRDSGRINAGMFARAGEGGHGGRDPMARPPWSRRVETPGNSRSAIAARIRRSSLMIATGGKAGNGAGRDGEGVRPAADEHGIMPAGESQYPAGKRAAENRLGAAYEAAGGKPKCALLEEREESILIRTNRKADIYLTQYRGFINPKDVY